MKYLLLVAVLLLFAGLAFLAMRWPQNVSKTFSQHAAAQKASSIYYFCYLALSSQYWQCFSMDISFLHIIWALYFRLL